MDAPTESTRTGTLSVAVTPAAASESDKRAWLETAQAEAPGPGQYLVWDDGGVARLAPLSGEWTRIGRSLAADVRFDDPTVSRRHALIVRQADGVRVLDDRSLNGVYVNGRRVEWSALSHGDEIAVGRHVLLFVDLERSPLTEARAAPAPALSE